MWLQMVMICHIVMNKNFSMLMNKSFNKNKSWYLLISIVDIYIDIYYTKVQLWGYLTQLSNHQKT